MNVNTGELRTIARGEDIPEGFTRVPKRHQEEAAGILGEKESAAADMEAETPLIKWAKSRQKKPGNNLKAMQKKSKKTNRRAKH